MGRDCIIPDHCLSIYFLSQSVLFSTLVYQAPKHPSLHHVLIRVSSIGVSNRYLPYWSLQVLTRPEYSQHRASALIAEAPCYCFSGSKV